MNLNSTTLIFGPLVILLVLTGLSVAGLGEAVDINQSFYAYQSATATGVDAFGNVMTLNDASGNPICYYNETSVWGEAGLFVPYEADGYPPQEAAWKNTTFTNGIQLFYDTGGADPVFYLDLSEDGIIARPEARIGPHWEGIKSFNLSDSWGWLALVAAITAIASFIGLKVFDSGESEIAQNLIIKTTFFITVWTTLSVASYPLILLGGFIIFILYFGMTLTYATGLILSINGGS